MPGFAERARDSLKTTQNPFLELVKERFGN